MRPYRLLCALLAIAAGAAGCATPPAPAAEPVSAPQRSWSPAGTGGLDGAGTPPAASSARAAASAPAVPVRPTPSARPVPTRSPSVPRRPTPPKPRPPVSQPGVAGSLRGTGSAAVALTFDDGPDPVNTPALLDVLARHGVKATFCLVGHRARDNQAIVARMAAEGHTLCNHSWQHLEDLSQRDEAYLLKDLRATNREIQRAVPGYRVRYFRAPYGNFTARLNGYVAQLGMIPIFWDVDDECYLTSTYGTGPFMVEHMISQVRRYTRPGSIILSHDMKKPFTIQAYRTMLPWLKTRFRLIALPAR